MKNILFKYAIHALAIAGFTNLIIIETTKYIIFDVGESKEILFHDLSISYITGYIIYFMTNMLPKWKLNKSNKVILFREARDIKSFIERRLEIKKTSNDVDNRFEDEISQLKYSDNCKMNKSFYEAFNDIYIRLERLKEFQNIVLSINDPKIYQLYIDSLKFNFKSRDKYDFHKIHNYKSNC